MRDGKIIYSRWKRKAESFPARERWSWFKPMIVKSLIAGKLKKISSPPPHGDTKAKDRKRKSFLVNNRRGRRSFESPPMVRRHLKGKSMSPAYPLRWKLISPADEQEKGFRKEEEEATAPLSMSFLHFSLLHVNQREILFFMPSERKKKNVENVQENLRKRLNEQSRWWKIEIA